MIGNAEAFYQVKNSRRQCFPNCFSPNTRHKLLYNVTTCAEVIKAQVAISYEHQLFYYLYLLGAQHPLQDCQHRLWSVE